MDIVVSDWKRLGSAIRDARKQRGLTQAALAEQTGVARSWLARVESGHRGAELERIFWVLKELGLTLTLSDASATGAERTEAVSPRRVTPEVDAAAAAALSARERTDRIRRTAWQELVPQVSGAIETAERLRRPSRLEALAQASGTSLVERLAASSEVSRMLTKASEVTEASRTAQALAFLDNEPDRAIAHALDGVDESQRAQLGDALMNLSRSGRPASGAATDTEGEE